MTQEKKTALLFVRIASPLQEDQWGIAAILQDLRNYAESNSLTVCAEMVQLGSDGDLGRPIDRLSSYLSEHREVSVVVVDRHRSLGRAAADLEGICKLVKDLGVEFQLVRERGVLSPCEDSKNLRLRMKIFSLLEQKYFDNWRAEIVEGQRRKAEAGRYPGRPRFGYRSISGRIEIYPKEAEIVKTLFSLVTAGQTDSAELRVAIARTFARNISCCTLRRILTSAFYTGDFSWGGRNFTGSHDPLVDRDIFDHVQKLLKANGNHEEGATNAS